MDEFREGRHDCCSCRMRKERKNATRTAVRKDSKKRYARALETRMQTCKEYAELLHGHSPINVGECLRDFSGRGEEAAPVRVGEKGEGAGRGTVVVNRTLAAESRPIASRAGAGWQRGGYTAQWKGCLLQSGGCRWSAVQHRRRCDRGGDGGDRARCDRSLPHSIARPPQPATRVLKSLCSVRLHSPLLLSLFAL